MPTVAQGLDAVDRLAATPVPQFRAPPASVQEIEDFRHAALSRLGVVPRPDWLDFLRCANGYGYDGVGVHGTRVHRLGRRGRDSFEGILEINAQLRAISRNADHLALVGSMDDVWLAWLPTPGNCAWIDPCGGRDEAIQRFDTFEAMFVATMMTRPAIAALLSDEPPPT